MADQQAGWYPDPSGDASKLRYWDGTQWTNDFTDAQQAAPSQPVAQQAQAAQPQAQPVAPAQPVQPATPVQPAQPQVVVQEATYTNPQGQQTRVDQVYVQAPAQKTNGLAIASFICGIVGLCPYTFAIVPIVAIILGALGMRNPNNKWMAITGLILGIVGIVIFVVILAIGFAALSYGY